MATTLRTRYADYLTARLKSVSDAIELARANKDSVQGRRTDLLGGNATKLGGKNTRQHILRRLARDHEDILAKFREAIKEQG